MKNEDIVTTLLAGILSNRSIESLREEKNELIAVAFEIAEGVKKEGERRHDERARLLSLKNNVRR